MVRALVKVAALIAGAGLILGLCSGVIGYFDLDEAISGLTVVDLPDDREDSPVLPRAGSPSTGPADAPVTVVVFGDYQDRFTRESFPAIHAAKDTLGDDVQLVLKHFPLPDDERALAASMAAIAAGEQGHFWAYHRQLLNASDLGDESLEAMARELGLDGASFDVARRGRSLAIDRDIELAYQLGVRGTPTLFVNGRKFEGVPDDFEALLRVELEAARGQTYARRVEINLGLVRED